ncbi:MAG: ParB/RepB/Spo0J family partition protein [Terriglobia bacterium]
MSSNEKAGTAGAEGSRSGKGVRIGPKVIPLNDLLPHPLNSNVMAPEQRAKLAAHIKQSGRYPFIVVRPHPDQLGKFQVLDGHHRVEVLRELGHTDARCDIWEVDDREAKLLLATLNRLQGQDLPRRRAQLLHDLLGEMSAGDLAGLLPESEKQIEELHALLEFPADEIAALLDQEAEDAEKVLPRVMTFVVTPEQEEMIERAVELASDGKLGRDRKAKGLANLAQRFLEARDHEENSQQGA